MFDAVALAAVVDELNEKILHGRVQEIVQLDALSFGFEIYAQHHRHYLYVTAHPDEARAHLVAQKLHGSGETPATFLLLLRKYADGALVDSIARLPNERVLKIQFDHAEAGISTFVVETIGKYSNLILVDAGGIVIDALKRVPATINRARVVLPKHPYVPPPPQAKHSPSEIDAADLARVLAEHRGAPLWQVLVKTIAGISPLLAREIEYRVSQSSSDFQASELLVALNNLVHSPWQPSVTFEDGEPAAFAPYPIAQFPHHQSFSSISAAIEAFYGAPDSYAAAKEPLRAALIDARDKLVRKRDALAQSLPEAQEIERFRVCGEMILAYASQIAAGQEMLTAETEIGRLEIPLNPDLPPVENAQRCFKEYHRAKDAAARVPALLAAANTELEYAEQMLNDLELAENRAEIDVVAQAARKAGLVNQTRRRGASKNPTGLNAPRVFQSRDGFTILVGKNARQNEEITFRRAKPDDLWLHARNVAGAHVVIVRAGREMPDSTVQEAGVLAARYSQARGDSRVDVIVAPRRNVHRVRGGRAGMVTATNEEVVRVNLTDTTNKRMMP